MKLCQHLNGLTHVLLTWKSTPMNVSDCNVNALSSVRSSTCDLLVSSFIRTGSSVRATQDICHVHRNHW